MKGQAGVPNFSYFSASEQSIFRVEMTRIVSIYSKIALPYSFNIYRELHTSASPECLNLCAFQIENRYPVNKGDEVFDLFKRLIEDGLIFNK